MDQKQLSPAYLKERADSSHLDSPWGALAPHTSPTAHRLIWGFLADQRGNMLMGSVKMGIFSTGPRKQVTSASPFSHLARESP